MVWLLSRFIFEWRKAVTFFIAFSALMDWLVVFIAIEASFMTAVGYEETMTIAITPMAFFRFHQG